MWQRLQQCQLRRSPWLRTVAQIPEEVYRRSNQQPPNEDLGRADRVYDDPRMDLRHPFQRRTLARHLMGGVFNLICYIVFAVWDIPVGWKWTVFILMRAGYGMSTLIMSWGHEICSGDNEERAVTIASMNQLASILQAWLSLIVWQQVDQPRYHKGYITITCLSVLIMAVAMTVRYLWERENA